MTAKESLPIEENALLKANAVQITSTTIIVAEDSGLCVNVLDGDPGVRTARWSSGTMMIEVLNCLRN
ncbi:non-canonical purine NTP pyrophosphatase [Paenibacillus polymyxa]|uniref:non-canonical purine NTP pyrophosphatase n=1 Tax=Paenibacillus polymyxa TaxID=1406 RepID=UPI0037CAEFEB